MRLPHILSTTARRAGLHGLGTLVAGLTLALFCSSAAAVAENPDPSLQGVSRSFIEANGITANAVLTLRGFNQENAPQIPRSGFDIINDGTLGVALLRGVRQLPNGPCEGLTDDAFFLVHVAGRPGDADGDGSFNGNSGICGSRRSNNPANPKIIDGNAGDVGVLAFGENLRLRLDRNCDGNADLVFSLTNGDPTTQSRLRVELDDFTGQAGTFPGGGAKGDVWEAALFPGDVYPQPCAEVGPIDGYYILRIPAFSSYFTTVGLNPGDFGFVVTAGSDDDGLGEDLTAGNVRLSEPQLAITKGPDLSLCPGAEGNYTITVRNDGNATVRNIVVSDQLPAGATLVSVVSGGVTNNGTTGLVTFSSFDLAQCEEREIVIRVSANKNCSGNDVNSASAAGEFATYCGTVGGELETTPVLAGPATAAFNCLPGPCVTATCTPDRSSACPGETVNLTVRGTNCSDGPVTMVLEIGVGTSWYQSYTCPEPVAAGAYCEHTFAVEMPACDAGNAVTFPSQATATNDCSSTTTVTPNPCSVNCKGPDVEIDKQAEAEVNPGDTIHYTITVTNESKDTDLTNVIVVDDLCSYVTNPTNFGGTCDVGAPQVVGSQITWPAFNLPANSSCTITFEVTAVGNATPCTETVTCTNEVSVTAECGDASDTASDSADTIIRCAPPGLCRLTGGGCLNDDPDTNNRSHKQHTFGGNSSPFHEGGGPTGNEWQHVHRDGREILFNWHSHDAHVIACYPEPQPGPCSPEAVNVKADFVGTGLYSIGSGSREFEGNMVAYIIDHREGSCNRNNRDEYSIVIREGLVIGEGAIVFDAEGEIDCGNLQIHETPARIFGGGAELPVTQSGIESIALLNRVVPNPFTSSMSFAYEVPEGGAAVEIGVYNVAGRLVKSLVSGPQSAGRQATTWDGRDNAGVQMARGVYFLKSTVGGKLGTHRVIYMNP
jgi:uncharacterized repeat protein (TIGR01451 family)